MSTKYNDIDRTVFRPSALPKLEQCIHYHGTIDEGLENEALSRGTRLHELCAQVLNGALKIDEITEGDDRRAVAWAIGEIQARKIVVTAVEVKLPIRVEGEEVTDGTPDFVGTDDNELWIGDYKSGDERDYSAQFIAYAKEVMANHHAKKCAFLVLYFDLREAREFDVTFEECEPRLAHLANRWLARGFEEPVINQYCGWCSLRGECRAWVAESKRALALSAPEVDLEVMDMVDRIEAIKANPVLLARAYTAYKRLAKLVAEDWKLKEAIQQYLESGVEVPGYTLGSRKGSASVDAEQALLQVYNELGSMRFAACISVDADKLRAAWTEYMGADKPFPLETTQGPTAYFPRAVQPKGTGAARLKRAERAKEVAA